MKGTKKVRLFCSCRGMTEDYVDEEVEADASDSELMEMARDFMESTLEPSWRYEILESDTKDNE